jgi:hypothetical protein
MRAGGGCGDFGDFRDRAGRHSWADRDDCARPVRVSAGRCPMSLVGGSAPTDQGFVRRSAQPPVPLGGPPEPHQRRGLGVTLRARFSAAGDPPLAQKRAVRGYLHPPSR